MSAKTEKPNSCPFVKFASQGRGRLEKGGRYPTFCSAGEAEGAEMDLDRRVAGDGTLKLSLSPEPLTNHFHQGVAQPFVFLFVPLAAGFKRSFMAATSCSNRWIRLVTASASNSDFSAASIFFMRVVMSQRDHRLRL